MTVNPTTTDRIFNLAKNNISIIVIQHGDTPTPTWTWSVLQGYKQVGSGLLHSDMPLIAVLKRIADSTTMPTPLGDMALRTLTWSAMEGFEHVPANELVRDDEIAFGGGAFTVDTVTPQGDHVFVTFTNGPSRRLKINQLCNLTKRGRQW